MKGKLQAMEDSDDDNNEHRDSEEEENEEEKGDSRQLSYSKVSSSHTYKSKKNNIIEEIRDRNDNRVKKGLPEINEHATIKNIEREMNQGI